MHYENLKKYQICSHCIMDTSDPDIQFNSDGKCSYCLQYEAFKKRERSLPERQAHFDSLIKIIKTQRHQADYDCLVGLSGGVDSSYVLALMVQKGLRPLAVHVDCGWNSELAVQNIERLVRALDVDLHTFVCDWDEICDLQKAFFKAGVANCDIPQDHTYVAGVYQAAVKFKIPYIMNGINQATEFVLPKGWGHRNTDLTYIKSIHKKYGRLPLKKYPTISFWQYNFEYPLLRKLRSIHVLDYFDYVKDEAKDYLMKNIQWRDYGGKHYESRFTRFFQAYYLPQRFGFDKRRPHLTSLILSGQMTRAEALAEMATPLYNENDLRADKLYISQKLGLSLVEFESLLVRPTDSIEKFATNDWLLKLKLKLIGPLKTF